MLTVQYPLTQVQSMSDLKQIPLRAGKGMNTAELQAVSSVKTINTPTEVDHYQLRRVIDVYVSPGEDLGSLRTGWTKSSTTHPQVKFPDCLRGSVEGMRQSFKSFGVGPILSIVLVYLILMAQFASFKDPFIILLAVPPGLAGVLILSPHHGTTLT